MDAPGLLLNIHAILPASRANGPGLRTVVWFQGCSIGCQGCFNPLTHSAEPQQLITPEVLVEQIIANSSEIEGITISGGEPFDQAEGLLVFLKLLRSTSGLSIVLLSGYTFKQIVKKPFGSAILQQVDVLIAGPFINDLKSPARLAGSSNKSHHFINQRYTLLDFNLVSDVEIVIDGTGEVIVSGIKPEILMDNARLLER
jgi:anaerobic ribonucleoside-triphosphate reductase activating protein